MVVTNTDKSPRDDVARPVDDCLPLFVRSAIFRDNRGDCVIVPGQKPVMSARFNPDDPARDKAGKSIVKRGGFNTEDVFIRRFF